MLIKFTIILAGEKRMNLQEFALEITLRIQRELKRQKKREKKGGCNGSKNRWR